MGHGSSILLVGGSDDDAPRLAKALKARTQDAVVERVPSANAALARLISKPPDLILILDGLPDMAPGVLCERLKNDPPTAGIPIMQVGCAERGPGDDATVCESAEGFAEGPVDSPAVIAQALALIRLKRRLDRQARRERALELVLSRRTSDLWAMEERYRLLVENSPDAIFVESEAGVVLEANPAACRLQGMSREEIIGRNVTDLVPSDQAARVRADFQKWFSGELQQYEGSSLTADGRIIPVDVRASVIHHGNSRAVILHVRDISERRDTERALEASREQLAQAQKMEAIGRLSGGVAHDFNNMLTAILGYAQILDADPSLTPDAKADLAEILRAAERAEELVKQLLAFSRRTPVENEPVDVNEAVRSMDRLLRRTLGKDIEIVSLLTDASCFILGDSGRLSQALMNLAVHARDAMPSGGKLTISTDIVTIDEDFANSRPGLHPGAHVQIDVSDTGAPLTEEERERVFEPFFNPGQRERGSGLGLAVVYSVAKGMGGLAEASSPAGGGTRFTLYFPQRTDVAVPQSGFLAGGADTTVGGTESILLVDDENGVRALAARMLRAAGYQVGEATGGVEAMNLFKCAPHRFSMVLTDIIMPQMTGFELIEQIRAIRPDMPAMGMTGFMQESVAKAGQSGGAIRVLRKPFTRRALLEGVRKTIDGIPVDAGTP